MPSSARKKKQKVASTDILQPPIDFVLLPRAENVANTLFRTSDFFFNDTATTEIYTLSLHDALPFSPARTTSARPPTRVASTGVPAASASTTVRSEEHTSELQSRRDLVCRLLLEKKKKTEKPVITTTHQKKKED